MSAPLSGAPLVFDRLAVRRHRARAAARFSAHDFLFREIGERLVERLDDVNRRFARVLDVGCRTGLVGGLLAGRAGIERVVAMDVAAEMVAQAGRPAVVGDEELLPFADASFDLVVSNLALHWTNDLPGALAQLRRAPPWRPRHPSRRRSRHRRGRPRTRPSGRCGSRRRARARTGG